MDYNLHDDKKGYTTVHGNACTKISSSAPGNLRRKPRPTIDPAAENTAPI
jgi:hypothetical protein